MRGRWTIVLMAVTACGSSNSGDDAAVAVPSPPATAAVASAATEPPATQATTTQASTSAPATTSPPSSPQPAPTEPTPSSAPIPPCNGSRMYESDRRERDDAGNTMLEVTVTNGSGAPCTLAGYPTIAGIPTDSGPVVPLNARQGTYFGEPEPAEPVVAIDGSLTVYITSSTSCEAAISGHRQEWFGLEMGLPSGSTMLIATNFDTICGVSVSAFGQPSP